MEKAIPLMAIMQKLVDKIEAHLDGDELDSVNVLSLAASGGVSPWYFQRQFKAVLGDTLGGYIRGRRLTRAAELLLSTEDSIIQIAFAVGFNSHEALTRAFKAQFDMTPKAFRQQRPSVQLRNKPRLKPELFQHITTGMDKEPTILIRPETLLVGFQTQIPSPFMQSGSYCDLLESSWEALLAHESQLDRSFPGVCYGLTISDSGQFDEPELTYLAAVEVREGSEIPEHPDLMQYRLPKQGVAVFEIADVDVDTVNKTMDYVYGYWLPNNDHYQRGSGDDYELFEGITAADTSNIRSQYVLPIQPLADTP